MVIELPYFELRRNINRFLGSTTLEEYRTMILISKNGKLRQILNDGSAIMVYQVDYDGPEFTISVNTDAFRILNFEETEIEIEDDVIYAIDDERITVLNAEEAVWFWDNTHPIYDLDKKEPQLFGTDLRKMYHLICFQPKLIDDGRVSVKLGRTQIAMQTSDEAYFMTAYLDNFKRNRESYFDVHYRNLAHVLKTIRKNHIVQFLSQSGKVTIVAKRMWDLYNFILPKYSSSFRMAPLDPKSTPDEQTIDLTPIQKEIIEMSKKIYNKNIIHAELIIDKYHMAIYSDGTELLRQANKHSQWPADFTWQIKLSKRFAVYLSKLAKPKLIYKSPSKNMIVGTQTYMWVNKLNQRGV